MQPITIHSNVPVPQHAKSRPLQCPACDETTVAVAKGQIEYDRCTGCGGVWLDCGELEVLLALAYRTGRNRLPSPLS